MQIGSLLSFIGAVKRGSRNGEGAINALIKRSGYYYLTSQTVFSLVYNFTDCLLLQKQFWEELTSYFLLVYIIYKKNESNSFNSTLNIG